MKDILLYNIDRAKLFYKQNKIELCTEMLFQNLKDFYKICTGKEMHDSFLDIYLEFEIPFTKDEINYISLLTKNVRTQEKFQNFIQNETHVFLESSLEKLKEKLLTYDFD